MIIEISEELLFVTLYLDEAANNKRSGMVSLVDTIHRIIEFRSID